MVDASPAELHALLPQLLTELRAAKTIVLGSHVSPDGDALGSLLAFSFALDQLGIQHEVLMHHDAPRNLQFLPGLDRIQHSTDHTTPDLAVILDLEAYSRLGSTVVDVFQNAKRTVLIDHHVPHEKPGDLRIVSVKSPATAAILCDLFMGSDDIKITPDMATCLLTGIVTDTGSFRFPNTTSHSLFLAANLLEAGADLPLIIQEVYMTRSFPSVNLLGHFLADMKTSQNGAVAWSTIPYAKFQQTHATDEDTEGFVNELLAIDGVQIAMILREKAPGVIRGSLRSRDDYDVAAVARQFGGGGHENAAGVNFEGDIAAAEAKLVKALEQCLASS